MRMQPVHGSSVEGKIYFPAHVRDFNQMMNAENAIKSGIVVVHSVSFIAAPAQYSPCDLHYMLQNMCENI